MLCIYFDWIHSKRDFSTQKMVAILILYVFRSKNIEVFYCYDVVHPIYKRRAQYEGNMKKFFQVPGPRWKLGIFPSPRALEEARNLRNMKKYERIMKDI